jgi:hypothetical protein
MERSSRRLDLPAFPRSRPRHPEQLTLSRLSRLRRLQLIMLLLQLGCLGLLILVMVWEPRPLCRLQQWSSSPRPATWPFTHLN